MHKTVTALALSAVLILAASLTAQTAAPTPKPASTKPALPDGLKAVGISVSIPDPAPEFPGQGYDKYARAGTSVSLMLVHSDKKIVRFHEGSKLESFTDDKGTKFSLDQFKFEGFSSSSEVSPDGHRMIVRVETRDTPAAGAKTVSIKGKLVVFCSPQTQEAVQKDMALAKDTQIELGPIKAKISAIKPSKWGTEEHLQVEFTNDTGYDALKDLTFQDASGKEIKFQQGGGMNSMGPGGKLLSATKIYILPGKPDKVTIKAVYYDKIEKLEVPIDLTVGLGL